MIVTLQLDEPSQRLIETHARESAAARQAMARALAGAASAGADSVAEQVTRGQLDLVPRNPGSGLAASVRGWMIDEKLPLAAVGVPANAPAAAYAGIHERGGRIFPVRAKALAVPVSDEARRYTSPRQMPDLTFIPRKGRPPLLVRILRRRGGVSAMAIHWVLLASVTIPARRWLSRGVEAARATMEAVFADMLSDWLARWRA